MVQHPTRHTTGQFRDDLCSQLITLSSAETQSFQQITWLILASQI